MSSSVDLEIKGGLAEGTVFGMKDGLGFGFFLDAQAVLLVRGGVSSL